jgi:ubiquinone/menaquinone biosynthesis C-methylase UbiE
MNTTPIMETLGVSAIVTAALESGLLEALTTGPATADALARKLSLDTRATPLVLDVLVALGLAERQGDTFTAAPDFLHAATKGPGGPAMLFGLWKQAPRFLRQGEPFARMDATPAEREAAYKNVVSGLGRVFEAVARELAIRVAERVPRRDAILDVGCGSGIWSLAIAERTPGSRVTGLDLPAVLASFEEKARELGLAERSATIPGDMHQAAIPPKAFNLAVIANVLRLEQPPQAAALVRKVAASLVDGGSLLIIDALAGGTREKELGRGVYAFHLGMRSQGGRVHPPEEVRTWLRDAGLSSIETLDLEGPAGGHAAMLARKARAEG